MSKNLGGVVASTCSGGGVVSCLALLVSSFLTRGIGLYSYNIKFSRQSNGQKVPLIVVD